MIQCIHSAPDSWGQRCNNNNGTCQHQAPNSWGETCNFTGQGYIPVQWVLSYPKCQYCGTTVTEGSTCPSCGEGI